MNATQFWQFGKRTMLELIVKNFNGTLTKSQRMLNLTPVVFGIYLNRNYSSLQFQMDKRQFIKEDEIHSAFLCRDIFSSSDLIVRFEVNIYTLDATATGCNLFINGEQKPVSTFFYNTLAAPDKFYSIVASLPNLTLNEVNKLKIIIELI